MHFLEQNPFLWFLLATPLFIVVQVYFLVRKMSEPENMFERLLGYTPEQEQMLAPYQDWLRENSFQYLVAFKFGAIKCVVYRQTDSPRFFSLYFHKRMTFTAETYFDDVNCGCLDTGTSGSTGMFPQRPHQYQQSFPGASPQVAWQRHLEGETYVTGRFGIKCQSLNLPYEQILLKAIRLRMQFVRSIPLYPFRALYWFAIMRGKMANRSIQQQFP
jgi:hypothetical protein